MNYATYDHALDTLDEVIEEIEMSRNPPLTERTFVVGFGLLLVFQLLVGVSLIVFSGVILSKLDRLEDAARTTPATMEGSEPRTTDDR